MTIDSNEIFARAWRPNPVEADYAISEVEGEIPRELNGTLYRNGPCQKILPKAGYGALHTFDGDGLVHAIRFGDGAAAYEARFAHKRLQAIISSAHQLAYQLLPLAELSPTQRVSA